MTVYIQGLAEKHDAADCFSYASVAVFEKNSNGTSAFWLISGPSKVPFRPRSICTARGTLQPLMSDHRSVKFSVGKKK